MSSGGGGENLKKNKKVLLVWCKVYVSIKRQSLIKLLNSFKAVVLVRLLTYLIRSSVTDMNYKGRQSGQALQGMIKTFNLDRYFKAFRNEAFKFATDHQQRKLSNQAALILINF